MSAVQYLLDNTDLSSYGLIVKASEGVVSLPDVKTPTSHDWAEMHGNIVDLSKRRLKPRTIKLTGYISASNTPDLITKSNNLFDLLNGNGMHILRINVPDTIKPLYYLVYLAKKIEVKKQWKPSREVMAEVTIELTEPEPVKRVVKYPLSVATPNIKITSTGNYNIRTLTEEKLDANSASNTITLNLPNDDVAKRFAIITGDIDSLVMTTNGTIEWSKL